MIALSNLYVLQRLAEIAQKRSKPGFDVIASELENWLFPKADRRKSN